MNRAAACKNREPHFTDHLVEFLIFRLKITFIKPNLSKIIQGILILEKIARFENAALVRSRADENFENSGPSTKPRVPCKITQ